MMWLNRECVVDLFYVDKPDDQFIREPLAGDILAVTVPYERYSQRNAIVFID